MTKVKRHKSKLLDIFRTYRIKKNEEILEPLKIDFLEENLYARAHYNLRQQVHRMDNHSLPNLILKHEDDDLDALLKDY
jgi:hypothetical protein